MVICSCRAVTERAVTEAIAAGARTVEHLTLGCSAGTRCGGCRPTLERLLVRHASRDEAA